MTLKSLMAGLALMFSICSNAQKAEIPFDDLPGEAKVFLKNHFKSGFEYGYREVHNNRITYTAILEDDTEIEFNESGKWLEIESQEESVPSTFIQKPILDFIKRNYPEEAIIKIKRSTTEFETELSSGLDLVFNAWGQIKREE